MKIILRFIGDNLDLKITAIVVATASLAAILNNPSSIAQSAASRQIEPIVKIIEPLVIEEDIVQKIAKPLVTEENLYEKISAEKKHYYDVSQAYSNSAVVLKGKCIGIAKDYCRAVNDICISYVFKTQVFYKHPAMESGRKYLLEDTVSLFSDVHFQEIPMSRFDRAVMNGGNNGGIYEPSATSIMPSDTLIVFASSKDGQYIIEKFLPDTKNNNKLLNDIVMKQAKK